jgi:2,3-dihydroxybenzoate-AMP ligase/mycobactin salicyl-AMP ligase
MERELTQEDRDQLIARKPDPNDIAHILPSGGTTGLPKGIPRTHNDYICNAEYVARIGEMTSQDVWLVVVPVGHNLALLVGITGCYFMGGKLVLLDSTRPEDICHTVQKEKVTFMPIVPSLFKRILDLGQLDDYRLDSLKKMSAGGEASSPELIRKAYQKIGCTYINEFGMSEGLLCRTRLDDDLETVCLTVGKPCCPYDHVRILGEEGKELPLHQDGELAAKGPGIFAGYLKNPEENRKSFTEDGFFRTGDLARIDESGNIRITGRIKDIIIRGGENISPAQVEDLLLSCPGVADAAVIGVPDKELGEKVCAYIRPAAGARLDPEGIKAFMLDKGASKLLVPEWFEFVDALPMTQAAKHDKKALREDMNQKMKNP